MLHMLRKMIAMLKVVGYGGLAVMLCLGIIGADGFVDMFKIENANPNGKIEFDEILIPKQIIVWTLGTVIIEVVDNFLALFETK